jgi:hypothetical protein
MPKPSGLPVHKVQGLEIYVTKQSSKTKRGKDRIWISVRQPTGKKWRLAASLCYVNAFDIRFEK